MPKKSVAKSELKEQQARVNRGQQAIQDILKKENLGISTTWCKVMRKEATTGKLEFVARIKTDFLASCQFPQGVIIFPEIAIQPVAQPNGQ